MLDEQALTPSAGRDAVHLSSMVAGHPWLAVDSQVNRFGQERPSAWSSPDGRRWRSDLVRATTVDGGSDRLIGVAQRGGTAVAAGEYASAEEGNFRPTAWWRDRAGTWHDVDAPRELFGGERAGGVVGVAAAPAGFIVVGGWTDAANHPDVGVWRSVNAKTWTRVDGEATLSPTAGEVVVATGATGFSGGFVVVGDSLSRSARNGLAWSSSDGLHWSRSAVHGSAVLHSVTSTPSGVVAVGLDQSGDVGSWRSADGRNWAESGVLASQVGPGPSVPLTSVSGAGADVLAAGIIGGQLRLWIYVSDRWRPLAVASGPTGVSGITKLVVAGAGSTTVLGADRASGEIMWFGGQASQP